MAMICVESSGKTAKSRLHVRWKRNEELVDLQPQQMCCCAFSRSAPSLCFLLVALIYCFIKRNRALCLLRSSFFQPFRICHSAMNDGTLCLPLPHMSCCLGVCWMLGSLHTPRADCPLLPDLSPSWRPSILALYGKLMLTHLEAWMKAYHCCKKNCCSDARLHHLVSRCTEETCEWERKWVGF